SLLHRNGGGFDGIASGTGPAADGLLGAGLAVQRWLGLLPERRRDAAADHPRHRVFFTAAAYGLGAVPERSVTLGLALGFSEYVGRVRTPALRRVNLYIQATK